MEALKSGIPTGNARPMGGDMGLSAGVLEAVKAGVPDESEDCDESDLDDSDEGEDGTPSMVKVVKLCLVPDRGE